MDNNDSIEQAKIQAEVTAIEAKARAEAIKAQLDAVLPFAKEIFAEVGKIIDALPGHEGVTRIEVKKVEYQGLMLEGLTYHLDLKVKDGKDLRTPGK